MTDHLLAEAHRFLDWARENGAVLDGSDESVVFVQGVLESMAEDVGEEPGPRAVKTLAYAVYLAELLAATCPGVRRVVDGEGAQVREVSAVRVGGPVHPTLSWVRGCIEDPRADDVCFKFAGALKDLGEADRAAKMYENLRLYNELRGR